MKNAYILCLLIVYLISSIASAAPVTYKVEIDDTHGFYRVFDLTSKDIPYPIIFKDAKNKTLNINISDTIIWENTIDSRLTIVSEQKLWNSTRGVLPWSYKRLNHTFTKNGTYNFYIKESSRFKQKIIAGQIGLSLKNSTKSTKSNSTKGKTMSNSSKNIKSNSTNSSKNIKSNSTSINGSKNSTVKQNSTMKPNSTKNSTSKKNMVIYKEISGFWAAIAIMASFATFTTLLLAHKRKI